jgi:phosphopantetheinyl transferase
MGSIVLIEQIGDIETLTSLCSEQDLRAAETLGAAHRRAEFLAWRVAVRRALGADIRIGYDEWGGPVIEGSNLHLGVSHSKQMVAVIISDHPCAIDIEDTTRNFEHVADRYVTAEERKLTTQADLLAVAWCAKETLYKYHRRGGVDFLRDVRLTAMNIEQGDVRGQIFGDEEQRMQLHRKDKYIIVTLGE